MIFYSIPKKMLSLVDHLWDYGVLHKMLVVNTVYNTSPLNETNA